MRAYLLFAVAACSVSVWPQSSGGRLIARSETVTVERGRTFELHLSPGYVSSVRVPDPVSAVVVGDPSSFKAEHSDAEPQMIFFKPTSNEPVRSNALVLTKSGQQLSFELSSAGRNAAAGEVDVFLDCRPTPASMTIPAQLGSVAKAARDIDPLASVLRRQSAAHFPNSDAKDFSGFVGSTIQQGKRMLVAFSLLNGSPSTIELLPPQVELRGLSERERRKKGHELKVEPVVVAQFRLSTRRLRPGERADGIVIFDRPAFKQGTEQLELRLAQAQQIDRPLVLPFPFTAAEEGVIP